MSMEKLGGLTMSNKAKSNVEELQEPEAVQKTEDIQEAMSPQEVEEPQEAPVNIVGTVINCGTLNVREEAVAGSKVLSIITSGASLKIDKEASTSEWFKVKTESGIEGYCARKYIALRY